ncbi:MAG TPA: elongation factor G [Candidatus Acidoferrales bacterium]|nr:elongation factor G [Candidatus Acidoferrales bacterium]
MKVYEGKDIRNLVVIGHSHSGKTSLVSAMLYTGGATSKLGRVDDGSTVTDYDEEAIARQMTVSAGIAPVEWHNCKINLLDTPGFTLFAHEAKVAMSAAEAAMVVVDGVSGVEVVTEKVWQYAEEINLPRVIVVSRMDRERANHETALESLRAAFGRQVVPVQLPIGKEKDLKGVIDLVTMKAYTYDLGGNGKGKEGAIPGDLQSAAQEAHEKLVEIVAEGKDELMEEFFDKGTISEEHLIPALHEAIRDDKIFPVLFASGLGNIGTDHLLDFVVDYCPTAAEHAAVHAAPDASGNGHGSERKVTDAEPASVYVFKTANDPFAGRITYFKVFSGVVKNDATLQNFNRSSSEKLSHLSLPQGKNLIPVPELHAGDIGAIAKLKDTLTGDTLGDKANPIQYPGATLPEPAITFAIEPKSRNDEDKLSNGLHKLMEEDQMVRFFRDEQTKEFLIAGTGQQHIEVIVSKLKKRYHTEVNLKAPKVPYRETIRGKADVQGRHKKQSGGHGQYGDCKIKMEPMERGKGFEFVNDIFGGAIPKNFIPAVEKGIVEAAQRGYLAGFPVVDFRVILYDGSYHDVDSNELSFKTAGRIAFKKAMEQAKPTLLEPIMKVEITIPDEFAGSIMGDLNSRRGRIQGMENKGGKTIVKAEVPMAEMLTYGAELTSMTQARGSFNMELSHYDYVPSVNQEKIITQFKAERGEVVEVEE